MQFKIFNGDGSDYVVVEGDTVEEIRKQADIEVAKRGWKDPYSEKVK